MGEIARLAILAIDCMYHGLKLEKVNEVGSITTLFEVHYMSLDIVQSVVSISQCVFLVGKFQSDHVKYQFITTGGESNFNLVHL